VANFDVLVFEKKRLIIGKHMAGDIDNLALLMKRISSLDRNGIDITLYGLRRALVDILANVPVYRTYVDAPQYRPEDRAHLEFALQKARERNPGLSHEFDFIQKFLLLCLPDYVSQQEREQWLNFVMRFQQYSGPLMAKGFEDTTLYIYNRLIALNEVGGWPQNPGVTLRQFHAFNHERAQHWPASLSATATHDTKRGEDVRARINVLSEIPAEWGAQVGRWFALNRGFKRGKGRAGIPDANDEYHLYQTLVGSWPCATEQEALYRQRLQEYMIKAVREAKVHTAWIKPDSAYEEGLSAFVAAVVDEQHNREFFEIFRPFVRKIAFYGMLNSLSQLMLKLTLPGVADIYQGCELWDLSLVDPDNRRAVDYTLRAAMLEQIRHQIQLDSGECIRGCYRDMDSGRIKLFLLHRLLQSRMALPELFAQADYTPLKVQGRCHNNLCAFARTTGRQYMVVLVPRFYTTLSAHQVLPLDGSCWGDTLVQIPYKLQGMMVEQISGRPLQLGATLEVAEALMHFPVALLISQSV
jgi:(1->4)-alpha-D-glucan 1-alpha-D-glucosylmutase